MLRPSKIFSSLHQLRHYFQTKVAELVVTPQQANNIRHAVATQQITLSVQHAFLKKSFQPTHAHQHVVDQKVLMKVIKQHMPIVKVFSSPTLHQHTWQTCRQQQFRTMMSVSGSSNSSGILSWGLPRTATIGVGRSPTFARQFSTTKSPSCVTLFQNNASANSGQSNVFAHISSRIFSPAGGKMNQNDLGDKQSFTSATVSPINSGLKCKHHTEQQPQYHFGAQKSDSSMSDLLGLQSSLEDASHDNVSSDNYQSACTEANSAIATEKLSQQKRTLKTANRKKLDSIIQHDDVSSLHSHNSFNHRVSPKKRHHLKHNRLKQFSSGQHYAKRPINESLSSVSTNNTTIMNKSITASTIYLLITLDTLQLFKDKKNNWTTENLNTSFIDSIETMAYEYQIHINYVLKLLDNLQRHGKFRIVARQSELRVYFPVPPKSKQDALDFLYLYNIIDSNYKQQDYFSIVSEDREIIKDDVDYFSYDPSGDAIGPDYFRDLQAFLDHTDYLIATSPAFSSGHH
ncbi:hypothetical protein BD560DRAFT_387441 [Blakeslea trispora]|nr:hypothetical protein BD560DRAFT_387441 [Blakeslea trispora]